MATAFITASQQPEDCKVPRKCRRSSVSLPALIRLLGQQHSAKVHNLSSGGAMIETTATVREGDPIAFSCGTIEADGKIVWTLPGRFGLEFRKPVDEEQIVRQLRRSDAVADRRSLREAAKGD